MASLKEKIKSSSAGYPATAVVRNYLAYNGLFKTRYCELYDGNDYHISITLYEKGSGSAVKLFCVNYKGVKNVTIERCYVEVAEFIESFFETQGLDEEVGQQNNPITMPDTNAHSSKQENVIITGAEDTEQAQAVVVDRIKLDDWSCSEKYYEFTDEDFAIMNRWFPLDSVKVTTSDSPTKSGRLLRSRSFV